MTTNTNEPQIADPNANPNPPQPSGQDAPSPAFVQPPAAENEGQPPEPEVAENAGFVLEMPAGLPASRIGDWEPVLDGFSEAAAAAGMTQPVAQHLVESFLDADIAVGGYTGDYTPDDAEHTLRGIWRDQYDTKLAAVHAAVKSLGDGFASWLDESEMGNHPGVLIALSNYDATKLTKAQAQAELQRIMGNPKSDYFSQDSWHRYPAVIRVNMLSRIAYAEDAPAARAGANEGNARISAAEKTKAAARKEATELLTKLEKGTPAERAATKKRFIELTAKL